MQNESRERDEAQRIHDASLSLLEDPGVRMENDAVVKALLSNGARPGSSSQVVRFPKKMVEERLALCPKQVVLADKRGNRSVLSSSGEPTFWTCPGMMLHEGGGVRPFTSSDMAAMSRLCEQLENVNVIFGMALDDVPPPARDVVGLAVMAQNSTKHLRALCFSPEGAEVMAEMRDVAGPYPWFSVGFTAHGPLRWTNLALEIFRRTAGRGIPATVNGEPMAGVSGPVTIAGSAAVGNAEILAGIVVNEVLEPGRPVIYNLGLAHIFDMKTAIAVTGAPENHLFAKLSAMMGRFYDLPSASWVSTESMCPDSQAALEKMLGFQTHVESGVAAIWGVSQLESEITVSPAQAVIDNEMIALVKRYRRGVKVTPETLALDVTRAVGIAGSFLAEMHTAENFRSEFYMPQVLLREKRAAWEGRGSKRLDERAAEVAAQLMRRDVENGLDADQARALDSMAKAFAARMKEA